MDAAQPSPQFVPRHPRTLLVEDDPGGVPRLRQALQAGMILDGVHVASDGVEALAILRSEGRFAGAAGPDPVLPDPSLLRMS